MSNKSVELVNGGPLDGAIVDVPLDWEGYAFKDSEDGIVYVYVQYDNPEKFHYLGVDPESGGSKVTQEPEKPSPSTPKAKTISVPRQEKPILQSQEEWMNIVYGNREKAILLAIREYTQKGKIIPRAWTKELEEIMGHGDDLDDIN